MFRNATFAGDWTALVDRLDRDSTLARWARSEPALAVLHSVDDVREALRRGADPACADAVVGALVRLAADAGARDDDALLLLLHLLSSGVLSVSRQLRDLTPNIVATVTNELACQIRAYPVGRRSRAWAANLLAETRRALLAEFRPGVRPYRPGAGELLLAPFSPAWEDTPLGCVVPGPGEDEDLDVVDLLRWAVSAGVDIDGVALLIATERCRARCPWESQDAKVAAQHGIALRTLYCRRERTLTELREVARDHLAAVA
jgi:hypothetical protein